jgi:predicted MFS family arabinose efflux permease
MPVAARDLDGLSSYSWAFNAYVVTSLVGMVLAGTHCDRHGPRLSLTVGVVVFAAGAALAGLAPTMDLLIAGRAVQGLGGGAAIVAVYVVMARAYDEALRPRAFTLLSAAWVLPSIVGPFVAGWLSDQVTWRAVFLLVPAFVLPPLIVLGSVLPRLGGGDPDAAGRRGRTRAALVAALGLALLQDGLLRLGWWGAVEGLVGAAVLVPALRLLLPAGALRLARGLPTTVLMRGLLSGGFFAAEVFVPLALIQERGVSTTQAGLVLTAGAFGWLGGSLVQGRLPGDRDRSATVRIGSLLGLVAVATLPLSLLPGLPAGLAMASWVVGATGMGLSFPSIAVQTLRLSPPEQQGVNSSALQLADSTLSVVALGITGAVYGAAAAAGTVTAATFVTLWGIAAAILLAAAWAAGRMRPVG